MKNILLLTDFSVNARNAILYAMRFFEKEKCTFHLMHVHKIGTFTSDDLMYSSKQSIYESITQEPRKKLLRQIEELKETFQNKKHQFEIHIDFDDFIDAINQVILNKEIDFMVMGTNGATGAKEVLLGSNTTNVIRKVNCKTLIIPEDYSYKPFKELLLPLDPQDNIKGEAFTDILEFIETYQLHLHVLRINPNKEDAKKVEDDTYNLAIIDCKYNMVQNVPLDFAIASYLQTNTIDLMALFVQKETFLERFFSKSNTKINISKISKPILVLHT